MNALGILAINGVASNADASSAAQNLRNATNIRIQIKGVNTGTPVGTFKLFGSEDKAGVENDLRHGTSTAQWTQMNIPEQAVHGSGYTAFSDVTDAIAWDGSSALDMLIDLDSPPAYMYVMWDRASGGSASVGKVYARIGFRGEA